MISPAVQANRRSVRRASIRTMAVTIIAACRCMAQDALVAGADTGVVLPYDVHRSPANCQTTSYDTTVSWTAVPVPLGIAALSAAGCGVSPFRPLRLDLDGTITAPWTEVRLRCATATDISTSMTLGVSSSVSIVAPRGFPVRGQTGLVLQALVVASECWTLSTIVDNLTLFSADAVRQIPTLRCGAAYSTSAATIAADMILDPRLGLSLCTHIRWNITQQVQSRCAVVLSPITLDGVVVLTENDLRLGLGIRYLERVGFLPSMTLDMPM
ncbi:MAG TPA: hypothetical protein DIS79_05680 [Bacteroidetes bacterium]|nr:hypothetical protein [Bacteroidota bacterium]